jgi:hypothetical protein
MSCDSAELFDPPPRRLRVRFSLLTLLVLVTGVCVAFGLFYRPPGSEVIVAFKVSAQPTTILGPESTFHPQEFEIFRRSQIEMIKNEWLLQQALRDPAVASLPILAGRKDPVAWLVKHLVAEFPEGGEILYIRLRGGRDDLVDLKRLVDAVANAYMAEFRFRNAQQQQDRIDAASRTVSYLREKMKQRLAEKQGDSQSLENTSVASMVHELELNSVVEQWKNATKRLETLETDRRAPLRIQQLHQAVSRESPGFPLR